MKYRITTSTLNIRSGPGTEFDIWDTIREGETFEPPDISGWLPVIMEDGTIGWLSAQFAEEVKEDEGPARPKEKGKQKVSYEGLKFISQEEGCILHVYKDPAGYPTIGIGHLVKPGEKFNTLTKAQALDLLASDISIAENAIHRYVTVPLTQNQFDALASFIFNVGSGNFRKSTLLKLLNQGKYETVPAQLMKWVNAGGRPLSGLIARRRREGKLWLS